MYIYLYLSYSCNISPVTLGTCIIAVDPPGESFLAFIQSHTAKLAGFGGAPPEGSKMEPTNQPYAMFTSGLSLARQTF